MKAVRLIVYSLMSLYGGLSAAYSLSIYTTVSSPIFLTSGIFGILMFILGLRSIIAGKRFVDEKLLVKLAIILVAVLGIYYSLSLFVFAAIGS